MFERIKAQNNSLYVYLSIIFILYASLFIYRTSFVTADGIRYFCLFDDAMISMRYAWNLSHGLGAVWNPGERVEGYTNPLWMLIMSVVTLFFDKRLSVLMIQIIGIFLLLIMAYLNLCIANEIIINRTEKEIKLIKIFAFIAPLTYYPLIYWTLMGMETGLLTLLTLLAILLCFQYLKNQQRSKLFLCSLTLSLAYLTRPDASIIFILIFGFISYHNLKDRFIDKSHSMNEYKLRDLFLSIVMYFAIIAIHLFIRKIYYGELYPNTYILKVMGMPLSERIPNGIGFITPFIKETWLIFVIVIINLCVRFSLNKIFLFSITISLVSYQIYVGGDPWFYWRIITPGMPLLLLLVIDALFNFIQYLSKLIPLKKKGIKVTTIVFLSLILLIVNFRFIKNKDALLINIYNVNDNIRNVVTALTLSKITNNKAVIGVFWAGALSYYTDLKSIDFLGKTDSFIAKLPPDISGAISFGKMTSVPGHNKYDLYYSINQLQPDYVQDYFQRIRWGNQDLTQELIPKKYQKILTTTLVKYKEEKSVEFVLILKNNSPNINWDAVNKLDIINKTPVQ